MSKPEEAKTERKPRTDEELFTLAEEIIDGKVWGSWMLKGEGLSPGEVFMPVNFMSPEQRKDIAAVYEHDAEMGPRCINGVPFAATCHCLSKDETTRLQIMYEKVKTARATIKQQVLGKTDGNPT